MKRFQIIDIGFCYSLFEFFSFNDIFIYFSSFNFSLNTDDSYIGILKIKET